MREENLRVALISFTARGFQVNRLLQRELKKRGYLCTSYEKRGSRSGKGDFGHQEAVVFAEESVREWTGKRFSDSGVLIFIGAVGIAVRSMAPWVKDKWTDPAVIAVDEAGTYVIPLLSGHGGGANELAVEASKILKGIPVITTATDINGRFAVDVFAVKNGLSIMDKTLAKEISAAVLEGSQVGMFSHYPIEGRMPGELVSEEKRDNNIWITRRRSESPGLKLVPKVIHIGVGCRRDADAGKIRTVVLKTLKDWDCLPESVAAVASIDRKRDEEGILKLAEYFHVPFHTFSARELSEVMGRFEESSFVAEVTGVGNVCERAAFLSAKGGQIICPKQIDSGVTVALAEENWKGTFEYG